MEEQGTLAVNFSEKFGKTYQNQLYRNSERSSKVTAKGMISQERSNLNMVRDLSGIFTITKATKL